ncbi:hypothetical protein J437_LFUL001673 [Ladona fulva]|uniref:JmjC domain-containing protein n=1 Tax=Ladona fulva TaxID=123851 RepID=A0A8K0K3X4_LADFU|nr:hypothetical protein J437_LFUL001673 [Ladona fulva]
MIILILIFCSAESMDTLKSVQSLLFSENGEPIYWQKSSVEIERRELFDVEGEIYLMKESEGLLHSSGNDVSSIIFKCTSALPKCQAAIESLWEKLNTGVWQDIPNYLRHLYSHASLIKSFALYKLFCYDNNGEKSIDFLKQTLKSVDLGLLLGLPTSELTSAARLYSDEFRKLTLKTESGPSSSVKRTKKIRLESKTPENIGDKDCSGTRNFSRNDLVTDTPWRKWKKPAEIPSLERPSLENFSKNYFKQRLPVILKNCLLHWPALKSWSPGYLAKVAGERTVPVELGPNYIHPAWGQKLMTIREFVNTHMLDENSQDSKVDQIGYLAQHPLFEQVPELRADIKIPEYCCLCDNASDDEDVEEPVINAWFGPKGTVSPLHYDPKHNLLAQVVGKKRVILYSCEDSKYLHPYMGQLLDNTSQIDPEDPETIERFPDLIKAEPWECEIQAGDMLYIPPKWWHHIRSLSVSFSVSFWWQ